jgi:uncharacterized protein DUF4129
MFVRIFRQLLPAMVFLLAILPAWPHQALGQSVHASSPQAVSLQEYIAQLDRCSKVLNSSPIDPQSVHELRTTLPSSWTISTTDASYTIRNEWLLGALSGIEHDPSAKNSALAQTREKIEDYRAEAVSLEASNNATPNIARAQARLDKILSAREFQGERGPTWFDLLKQRIYAWIDRQLERIFGHVRANSIGIVAWIVVGLVSALMLFWTLRFLLRPRQGEEMNLSGATPVGRDWRRWLREAKQVAGGGDYRAAIHAAYWAAIVRMEEMKTLPEDRARTPRESLRLIDRGSAAYTPLLELTRRFELVWYGYRAATAADWNDAARQLESLGCPRF